MDELAAHGVVNKGKALIVPNGYSVRVYPEDNLQGKEESFYGYAEMECQIMKGNNNPDLQNNMESFNMKNDFHDVTTFYSEWNC